MRIIIDFDYTLFDVEALRRAMIAASREQAGVTEEQFRSAEQAVKHELGFYEPERHAARLVANEHMHAQLVEAWMTVVDHGESFLYPDAVDFLHRYHDEDTVLLSFGNEDWQRRKIEGAGIADMVDHVVITSQPKTTIFPTLITQETSMVNEPLFMVNDRGSELDALKQLHPTAVAVWLRRPNDPYTNEPCTAVDMTCTNLDIDFYHYSS